MQLEHPDRAFTGWQEPRSDAWQARVLEVGSAHGNLPGDAEGSTLPTSEVIIGPDQLVGIEPVGTFHGPWSRRQRAGGVATNAPWTQADREAGRFGTLVPRATSALLCSTVRRARCFVQVGGRPVYVNCPWDSFMI